MENKEYSKKYYKKVSFKNNFSLFEKIFLNISTKTTIVSRYYYVLLNVLNKIPEWWEVLDVWVANWTFLNFIKRLRPDLKFYWLDITDTKDLLPDYINFIKDDATNFNLNKKFDLIISNHLIEHLPINLVPKMLWCINNHLSDDSIFLFVVPSLSEKFYNDPTHIRPYNKTSMETLLKISNYSNFKIYEENYFKFPLNLVKFRNFKITFWYAKK